MPSPTKLSGGEEVRLLAEGERFFAKGDIASARLFYLRAAQKGSAVAALAIARTYDPVHLSKQKVPDFHPDPRQAEDWYKKAIAGGVTDAESELANMRIWMGLEKGK